MKASLRSKIRDYIFMVGIIGTLMGGAATILWQWYAVPKIEVQINEAFRIAAEKKPHSLSANVSDGLDIDRDKVDEALVRTVKTVDALSDSIGRFTRDFFPAILRAHQYINVGLKVNRRTMVVYYLANDSIMYQAIPNDKGVYHYYKDGWKECQ